MRIYPNPFSVRFTVEFQSSILGSPEFKLIVSNVTGAKIYESQILVADTTTIAKEIVLSSVPEGVYFVTIKSGSSVRTTKIIKK